MNLLFLDDDFSRFDAFRARTIGCVVDWAVNAKQACELLGENDYDGIFLDHDLHEAHYASSGYMGAPVEPTGSDVAAFIARSGKHKDATIIIHSLNPDGAKRMAGVLNDAGYDAHLIPFAWKLVGVSGGNLRVG